MCLHFFIFNVKPSCFFGGKLLGALKDYNMFYKHFLLQIWEDGCHMLLSISVQRSNLL